MKKVKSLNLSRKKEQKLRAIGIKEGNIIDYQTFNDKVIVKWNGSRIAINKELFDRIILEDE